MVTTTQLRMKDGKQVMVYDDPRFFSGAVEEYMGNEAKEWFDLLVEEYEDTIHYLRNELKEWEVACQQCQN